MSKDQPWHAERAEYDEKAIAVRYERIADFHSAEEAEEFINAHAGEPICVFHEDCVHLDNPYFARIETDAYKAEEAKETEGLRKANLL